MSIEMYRYTGKSVTPLIDSLMIEKSAPVNGINDGCVLSHLGSNQVAITSGHGRINGRDFGITAETMLVQLASSGTMPGRIYIKINLADSVNTIQLLSVCASSLPALVQDANFNLTNGIWEMELATYSATTTAISGLTTTYTTVKKSLTENNIVNANTTTEAGYVADARQLNPNVTGSFAKKLSGTILWTNSNTTVDFATQTVALSETIANFTKYEIIYRNVKTLGLYRTTGKLPILLLTRMNTFEDGYIKHRELTALSGTTATFGGGFVYLSYGSGSPSAQDFVCIPYQIIGY